MYVLQSSSLMRLHSKWLMSNQPEGTFERLRYSLGGNRPSQTAHLTMSLYLIKAKVRNPATPAWYPNDDSVPPCHGTSKSPTYPVQELPNPNIKLQ